MAPVLKLGVFMDVFIVFDHSRRYASRLHHVHNIQRRMTPGPYLHQLVQIVRIPGPVRLGGKLPVFGPGGIADYAAKALPLFIGEYGDGAPIFFTPAFIHAVGRGRDMGQAVACPLLLAAINRVVQNSGLEAMDGAFELGQIYMLSMAGSAAVIERSHNGHRREMGCEIIGVGRR